jgi:hypothetical protein
MQKKKIILTGVFCTVGGTLVKSSSPEQAELINQT